MCLNHLNVCIKYHINRCQSNVKQFKFGDEHCNTRKVAIKINKTHLCKYVGYVPHLGHHFFHFETVRGPITTWRLSKKSLFYLHIHFVILMFKFMLEMSATKYNTYNGMLLMLFIEQPKAIQTVNSLFFYLNFVIDFEKKQGCINAVSQVQRCKNCQ